MQLKYGAVIKVFPPGQETPVTAQIGQMTPEGPTIHIASYQMEAPAQVLKAEGWRIPDLEQSPVLQRTMAPAGQLEADAAKIVRALLDD